MSGIILCHQPRFLSLPNTSVFFFAVSWWLVEQTPGLQLQSSSWLVVNNIRLSIKSGTQPQLILCSHTGTGQCTGKNVANIKLMADCLSQQYHLSFLVTISWQFCAHPCRVSLNFEIQQMCLYKGTLNFSTHECQYEHLHHTAKNACTKQATSNCLLAWGNMYLKIFLLW